MRALGLVAAIAVLCGCAHAHVLSPVPAPELVTHFNSGAAGAQVKAEMTGGDRLVITWPMIREGTLLWYDSAAQQEVRRPLSDFRELRLKSTRHGAVDGVLIGSGLGVLAGGVLFAAAAGMCQGTTCSVSSRLPLFLLAAAPSALIGLLIGDAVGATDRFAVSSGGAGGS